MTCPNCGKSNKETEPFCSYCGAALVRAKTQKNVQKAVDAYVRKPRKTEEKNLLPAIIIICLCVLLVVVLILVIPKLINLLNAPEEPAETTTATTPVAEDAFSSSNPYYECHRKHKTYVLPGSDTKYLTREDLKDLTDAELTIALQEIYARHGHTFSNQDLKAYFENRTWYKPSESPTALNTYETANAILLDVFIDQKDGSLKHRGNLYLDHLDEGQDYVCKDSATEYLTGEELKDLEEEALTVAYWELYARRGHVLTDPELLEYFYTKEWYTPGAAVSDASFNEFEADNKTLIEIYQKRLDSIFPTDNPYMDYFEMDAYVFPDSDTKSLEDETFLDNSLTEEMCILGRNEIYARHGYVFSDEQLMEYFLLQEWYLPSAPIGDMSKLNLSSTEKKNVAHLEALETAFKSVPEISSLNRSMTYTVTLDKVTLTLPAYWKDYADKNGGDTKLSFCEKFSADIYGGDMGLVCTFEIVAAADYTGPGDIFVKVGVVTDADGNEWFVTRYKPSDVRHCFLGAALGSQMHSDLSQIQITAVEGYTYTPC